METAKLYLNSGQIVTLKALEFTVVRNGSGHFQNLKWVGEVMPVPLVWPSASEVVMLTVE